MEIGFKAAARAAQVLGDVIARVMDAIKAAVRAVTSVIDSIAGAIQHVIDLIGRIKIPKLPDLNPFSRSAPPAGGVTAANRAATAGLTRRPAGATARSRAGARAGAGVTVNVYGALDPDAVARQIRNLLARADVRNGSRVGVTSGWATPVTGP
jgi:hypothetical protein